MWFKLENGKHINLAHVAYIAEPLAQEFYEVVFVGAPSINVCKNESAGLFEALDYLAGVTTDSIAAKKEHDATLQRWLETPLPAPCAAPQEQEAV